MIDEDILNDLDDLDSGHISEQNSEDEDNSKSEGRLPMHSNHLLSDQSFRQHMKQIEEIVDSQLNKGEGKAKPQNDAKLIQKSNQYASVITKEINVIFRFVKTVYYKRFPELESIVTQPALYCKAVREIEREERGQETAKFAFLTNHQKMSLQLALSTIHDKLAPEEATEVIENSHTAALLYEHNNLLMIFLESCMQMVAPNLCELVGSLTASKLISVAGGVKELAAIPACNIQVLGGQRSAQIGFGQMERNHTGIFSQMDVVKDAPKDYQMQLVRMFASNTAKCARADMLKSSKGLGARLREELFERYDKVQEEGGLHRIDQPLPVPDLQPKKKRGGGKHRRMKELYEMTEVRKQQNRLKFGEEAEVELGQGVGMGMLSQGGKLKVQIKKQKLNTSKKMTQRLSKQTGFESTVNITGPQGIELKSLDETNRPTSGSQTIFSKSAGFTTVLNGKFGAFK